MNNLPKVVAPPVSERESNPRPLDHSSDALPVAPPGHLRVPRINNDFSVY